jgi:predicted P-loop ATPase
MSKVSIFKNVGEVKDPTNMDLLEYLEKTRDGEWEDIVSQCRRLKTKEEKDEFKRTMPTTTLSGEFSYRSNKSLLTHSEYIAMDLDYVESMANAKRRLSEDKFVYSVFMSTSGYGLRVLFKIEPEHHDKAFYGLCAYLFENYDLVADPNGVSVSKPYVVSFDPDMYISFEEVPVFKKYPKETSIKKIPEYVHTTTDFENILKQITGRGINICETYSDWLKIGFAFAEEFGEGGRSYFHEISQFSQKYKTRTTDNQYNQCLKANGIKRAGLSSFYYLAKLNNVNICSEQTRLIIRTTKSSKQVGLNAKQIIENLKKNNDITGVDEIVNKIFEASDRYEPNDEESILFQLEIFIMNNYNLRMNEVSGFLEQNKKILSESDLNTIFIAAKKLIPSLDYRLMIRLLKSQFIETYNPFFEFFGSDGIPVRLPAIPIDNQEAPDSPLIDLLASCIKNNNPGYTLYFTRKWLVSIISSAHKVHSPLLHCLLGPPETGKTEFYRRLLPPELKEYYAESKLDKGKDDEILMTQYLIIMDDELGGKSKQEASKLKNITSTQYYYLRRPYGENNEKILRLAVLCGTSNIIRIMNDPTPNRRIIPIEVEDIDRALYNSINKKELFMEAYRLYKSGFDWRVSRADMEYLNKDHDKFEHIVKERELIQRYYEPGTEEHLTSTDILVELELLTKQKLNSIVLYRELEHLGFVRRSRREGPYATTKKWGVNKINRYHGDGIKTENLPF